MQDINFDFSVLDNLEEIPETSADIEIPDEVLSGPETAEDNGVANLLLDAISNSTDTIQMYNAIIANTTDENLITELNEILVDENRNMGKLQALLQNVSPNAEEIMNGAIEIQGVEDSPVDESLNEAANNRVTLFCTFEPYERYVSRSGLKKLKASGKDYLEAISKLTDKMGLYIDSDRIEEDGMTFDEVIDSIEMSNGDGCDYIVELKDNQGNVYIQAEYENDYEDVDESLKEDIAQQHGRAIPYQVSDDSWRVKVANEYRDLTEYDVWGYGSTTKPKDFYSEIAAEDAAAEYNQRYEDIEDELDESLILDENNNLDTALDDVTPVRDVHNERAIRDHKKAKEDRKKAMKEISKNIKDAFELDESLFESFYLNYEDSDLLQDWDQGGLDFSVDIHPYKYEFYTSRDANKALKIAISHGYKDSWREGHYVYLTAH